MLAATCALGALLSEPASHAQSGNTTLVQGYVRFMAYHEAGHLLMSQIQGITPKTAPTEAIERTADDFATVLLMPDADDPMGVSEILGAAMAWLRAGPRYSASDPHAPPAERAEQIICHVYGSDPVNFAEFAEIIRPDWDCEGTFNDLIARLEDNYLNQTSETGFAIDVEYEEPAAEQERAAQFLADSEILEDLAFDIEQEFKLVRPTKLKGVNCKAHGANSATFYYDAFANFDQITLCYELIGLWLDIDFNADP